MAEAGDDLVLVQCGGNSIIDSRPCFDHDNTYLFCCSGSEVRAFSVETGECVRSFAHAARLVAVCIDREDASKILTCTVNGVVSQWDYECGEKTQEWSLSQKVEICEFLIPSNSPDTSWYIIITGKKEKQLCSLTRTRSGLSKRVITNVPEDHHRKVAVHSKGHLLVYAIGKKLWIRDLQNEQKAPWHLAGPGKQITFVACHPTKDSLAVGDELGRICLWHKVAGNRPVYTMYHWHTLPVTDLVFSSEGSVMYSGGFEMVVVRWSLQSSSKEETKDFLPRLPANIRSMATSPDSSILAISLEDNSVIIASSQLKILNSVRGFVRNADCEDTIAEADPTKQNPAPLFASGLIFDDNSTGKNGPVLITNGRPGYLQFYDPNADRQRMILDVVGINQPPAERNARISYFEVAQTAICDRWLATLEHRHDPQYSDETNLKFWLYDQESESFKLRTCVDRPHQGRVTCLFFRKSTSSAANEEEDGDQEIALISTGDEGKVKIWELSSDGNIYGNSENVWSCDRVGYYRGQPATCGDLTSGGDLGIGFGHTLTIWRFEDTQQVIFAKSVLAADCEIKQLQFGVSSDEAHLVAVLSDMDLSVWDVSSELCLWRVKTAPDLLCKDTRSGLFAAFFGPKVCFFGLQSPDPKRVYDATENNFRRAVAATFGGASGEQKSLLSPAPLYFVTDAQKVLCLRTESEECSSQEKTIPAVSSSATSSTTKTPFARLLAETESSKRAKSPVGRHEPNYQANMQLLAGPAHTLPSVSVIGPRFAESCLSKRRPANEKEFDSPGDAVVYPDVASEVTFESLKALYS